MSDAPGLPDLAKLSGEEKDLLILSLYETLLAVEGGAPAPAAGKSPKTSASKPGSASSLEASDLKRRIAGSSPSRRAQTTSRAGPGAVVRLLTSRSLQIVLVLLGLAFAADFAVGRYERGLLESERQAALELRSAAFDGLYVELLRVAYEPGGRGYRATMTMQNSHNDAPLYVMMSPVRVFVQAGLRWQEVPAGAPPGAEWGVIRLDDARDFSVVFQADLKDWTELIPGYMHVRIDSQMLISRRSAPKDDIVERNNVFYVYLKPQGADDEAIKRRSRFPGTPPVFIPMPPH